MATGNPTYGTDGLVALTIEHRVKQLIDQVFKRTVLLFLLGGAEGRSPRGVTGRSIVQELLYGDQSNVGSFSDDDVFAAPSRDGITAAEFPWRRLKGSLTISGEEMDANSGPEQAVNLAEARLKQTMRTMSKDLNAQLHSDGTGNSNKDFDGLAALVAQANVYGGIDRSDGTNAWWRAFSNAIGGAYDEADLRTTYNTVVDGAEKPTHILTTQEGYESYEGFLQNTVRHEDTMLGDAGFDSLMFKSTPMVFDRDVPDATIYLLNLDHLELVSNNNRWFTPSDWLKPVNQDIQVKNIISAGNLVTDQANLHAVMTGVTNA